MAVLILTANAGGSDLGSDSESRRRSQARLKTVAMIRIRGAMRRNIERKFEPKPVQTQMKSPVVFLSKPSGRSFSCPGMLKM